MMDFFFWNALTGISLLVAVEGLINKRVGDMGIKMLPKNSPVVCNGYVKYKGAEVDRLAIIQDFRDNEKKRIKMAAGSPF